MKRILAFLLALALATPAAAQQPTGFLDAPRGAPVYVTPNAPLPVVAMIYSQTGSTSLSTSTTTANVALPSAGQWVKVTNGGSVTAYVALGVGSGTVATTGGYPVPAGQAVWLNTANATYIAGITATSTASLTVSSGTLAPFTAGGNGTVTSVSLSAPLGGGTVTTTGTLGTTTYTAHGIVLGEGASALAVTAAMSNGQLLVGQTGADPLPESLSGDCTLAASGAITCTKTNGVAFATSATTDTTSATNITTGTLPCAQTPIGGICTLAISVANVASTGDVGSIAVPAIGDFKVIAGNGGAAYLRNWSGGAVGAVTATIRTAASGGGAALFTFTAAVPPASGSLTASTGATTAANSLLNSSTTTTLTANISASTATGTGIIDVPIQRWP